MQHLMLALIIIVTKKLHIQATCMHACMIRVELYISKQKILSLLSVMMQDSHHLCESVNPITHHQEVKVPN